MTRFDAGVRLGAALLLWAALLLVTYWWVADGGVRALSATTPERLTALGQWTGLAASVLLLAQVVLMARVPLLEHAWGQDELTRVHRVVGFTSFNLLLLHLVLITWGYAGRLDQTPRTLWSLTIDYPGMLLAVAGTLCLVAVTMTSIRAARRTMRYESWHLLHLYAYLGVGLALPHQLWTGQQFLARPAAVVFWWSAWGLAAGSLLVWRVLLPLIRSGRAGLRVTEVVQEAPGTHSIHLRGDVARLGLQAGQFFTWRFLGRAGWTRGNPYSISSAPTQGQVRITVQGVGVGSAALATLRPGTKVLVEGPFGRLSERARTSEKLCFIGAGVGVAPLRSLAEGMAYAPGDAIVMHRFRDDELFAAEWEQLERARGLRVVRMRGRRRAPNSWVGEGYDTLSDLAVLLRWVPDIAERDVYVCGPHEWIKAVHRVVERTGLAAEQWHSEEFAMA